MGRRYKMRLTNMTIEEMCSTKEKQKFDRKSAKIESTALATPIIAFANADGGLLAIGIEDKGEITGIDDYTKNVNELLRASLDFCQPSIMVETEEVECVDSKGNSNHILLMRVPQSGELHANHRDEVFLRAGDKSKKLTFDERMQLMYAKGARYYEDEPVYGSSLDDIDMDAVSAYCQKIGYGKTSEEYIQQNKKFIVEVSGRKEMSGAAILLFGKEPQLFFQRARVRFIRYEGTEAKVGAEMNVIKDITFEGRILDLVEKTIEYVRSQIKEHTYLGPDARFITEPEYPEFVWKETIVNAIAHRDYSIKGTDIQIKMFDDHITVESPGTLPGIVRLNNMREIHFSRNPKIAELLHEYEYVREFGEGIDRMYQEMQQAGLPEPEYRTEAFMVYATIKNKKFVETNITQDDVIIQLDNERRLREVPKNARSLSEVLSVVLPKKDYDKLVKIIEYIESVGTITPKEVADITGKSTATVRRYMKILTDTGYISACGNTNNVTYVLIGYIND